MLSQQRQEFFLRRRCYHNIEENFFSEAVVITTSPGNLSGSLLLSQQRGEKLLGDSYFSNNEGDDLLDIQIEIARWESDAWEPVTSPQSHDNSD